MITDINQLAAQVAKGIQGATSQSPLGAAPEIANLGASGLYNQAEQLKAAPVDYNAAVSNANRKQAASEAAQKAQIFADIKNYQTVRKADGGFDYYDPAGKQVDIATVAANTGNNAVDLIKDSNNPIDIQYQSDYSNMQKYISAVINKDTETVKAFQEQDPALKNFTDKGGLDKLVQLFQQQYQRYYVPRTANPQAQYAPNPNAWGAGVGNPLFPSGGGGTSSASSILAQLQGLAGGQ